MIRSQDRSGWFGASDTARIMGNWKTQTFGLWWLEKLGLRKNNIKTKAIQAGIAYEHRILDFLGIQRRDRQFKKRQYRLRVNLDGEDKYEVFEVKTHGTETFKVTKAYWQQAQVEMYATGKDLDIVAYRLMTDDYQNYFNPIDVDGISFHPVEYDAHWIHTEYLPRLTYLAHCLRKKVFPTEHGFENFRSKNSIRWRLFFRVEAIFNKRLP